MLLVGEHEVEYLGGAQTLMTIPTHPSGAPERPTSPTYAIELVTKGSSDSARIIVAETAATLDALSTTTTAASGPTQADARKLSLTDGTLAKVGRVILVKDARGAQLVKVGSKSVNDIYADIPLSREFASGATVQGIEVSGTFPSVEAAKETMVKDGGGPYRVTWSWTFSDGTVDTRMEFIWLRRKVLSLFVTTEELFDLVPRHAERATPDLQHRAIRSAHRDYWRRMKAAGLPPERYYDGDAGGWAVSQRSAYYLALWIDGPEAAEPYEKDWMEAIANLKTGQSASGTAQIDVVTDTAPAGPDLRIRSKFRRS